MNGHWNAITTVARKELRESIRNRWLWAMATGFALLAVALTLVGLPGARTVGAGGFGRTAASLVALAQLMAPLLGLTVGAQALATARERGTLRFVLAHPISRRDVLAGMFLGLAAAVWAAVLAGFGAAALVSAALGSAGPVGVVVSLTILSGVLATSMLALGISIGAGKREASTALGTAIFVWLLLVFAGDLGIMGSAMAVRMPVGVLFFSVLVNPVEAFRMLAVPFFATSLDVLGPAGSYAVDTLGRLAPAAGAAVLLMWIVVPALVAARRFRGSDF